MGYKYMIVTLLFDKGAHGGYNIYVDKYNLIYGLSCMSLGRYSNSANGEDCFPCEKSRMGLAKCFHNETLLAGDPNQPCLSSLIINESGELLEVELERIRDFFEFYHFDSIRIFKTLERATSAIKSDPSSFPPFQWDFDNSSEFQVSDDRIEEVIMSCEWWS